MSIKSLRIQANLTQTELAEKLEVDQTAVSNWENGKNPPLPKYQRKLAEIFGVTVEEVLKEEVKEE